jgi:sec-independent protein translocase protein TatB
MFDIGFSEIVVIAVVALVVLGPEKLPKAARTLGHLFGRLQRYVNDVKGDIQRELELDELRKLQQNVQTAAKEIEESMSAAGRDVEAHARDVEAALNAAGDSATAAPPPAPVATPPASVATPPEAEVPPPATPAAAPASSTADASRQASLPGFDRG